MSAMSFNQFIKTNPKAQELFARHKSWTYQFDFYNSLERAFSALIYCSNNYSKISYKNLGQVANVDAHYLKAQALGNIMSVILEIIGTYCQTLPGAPKLTSLCVGQGTGLPSEGYFAIFDRAYIYADDCDKASHVLSLYASLANYSDWHLAKLTSAVTSDDMKGITIAQDEFAVALDPISVEMDLATTDKKIHIYRTALYGFLGIAAIAMFSSFLGPIYTLLSSILLVAICGSWYLLFTMKSRQKLLQSKMNTKRKTEEGLKSAEIELNADSLSSANEIVAMKTRSENSTAVINQSLQRISSGFKLRALGFRTAVFVILVLIIIISGINFLADPLWFLHGGEIKSLTRAELEQAKFIWIMLQTLVPLSVLMIYCGIMERRYSLLFLRYHEIGLGMMHLPNFMKQDKSDKQEFDKEAKLYFAKKYFGNPVDLNKSKEKDFIDLINALSNIMQTKKSD